MTRKRDLKRRVRERQAETGESYTAARRRVVAEAARPAESRGIPVVEMISLTEEAKRLGLACRVVIASTLASRVAPDAVLERVKGALEATADDPGTELLRAAVLRGEMIAGPRTVASTMREARRFIARARAGIGGVSDSGSMIALPVDAAGGSVMVVGHIGYRPVARPMQPGDPRVPRLVLTTVDHLSSGPDQLILWIP